MLLRLILTSIPLLVTLLGGALLPVPSLAVQPTPAVHAQPKAANSSSSITSATATAKEGSTDAAKDSAAANTAPREARPWTSAGTPGVSNTAPSKADLLILEMQQAYKTGDRKTLSALLPQVQNHLLVPWAAYWELRIRLETAAPEEIQAFLTQFKGSYQEDRLRNDWLLQLGRARDWPAFAQQHAQFRMADDREVACYAMAADTASGSPVNVAQFRQHWYGQREADEGCAYLAGQLFGAKKITETDVWRKARLGVEGNRLRMARQATDLVSAQAGVQLDELYKNAGKFLAVRSAAPKNANKEFVTLAVIKLAASDPDAAASAMEKHWNTQLSSEQRSWAWGAIGKSAALKLRPDAPALFANAKDDEMSDEQLGWKVRANLRSGNWKEVLGGISAMSDKSRTEPVWIYWKARALLTLLPAEPERADAQRLEVFRMLQNLASQRGFYEQLAAEDLGRKVVAPPRPEPALSDIEKQIARTTPGLNRALAAINLGLRAEGVREWNYHTNLHTKGGMDDRTLLAAAEYACEREVWDRCINTSERTKTVFDVAQRYPLPFKDAVLERSRASGLDAAYAYGIMRQESRFVMDARSSVGAAGLMQLMPATARWTAKKIGLTDFQPHHVVNLGTNLALGTGYLKMVLDSFSGSMPLAAAAYNAGPGRPRNWRGQAGGPVLEAAIWMENVPFNETRDYVKNVMANTTVYAAVLTGKPQSLKARLGQIGPRGPDKPDVDPDLP